MHYAFDYTQFGVGIRPFPIALVAPTIGIAMWAGLPLVDLRDSEVIPCRTLKVVIEASLLRSRTFDVRIFVVAIPHTEQHHAYDAREDFRRVGTLIRFSRCSAVFPCILRSILVYFPPMLHVWLRHFLFCGLPWLLAMFLR